MALTKRQTSDRRNDDHVILLSDKQWLSHSRYSDLKSSRRRSTLNTEVTRTRNKNKSTQIVPAIRSIISWNTFHIRKHLRKKNTLGILPTSFSDKCERSYGYQMEIRGDSELSTKQIFILSDHINYATISEDQIKNQCIRKIITIFNYL